jgi:predicted nucleotidyltransferase
MVVASRPSAREAIDRIVERLVAEYAPEKIVLFGSYAYGVPNEDSDIDLLIIKQTKEPFFKRLITVRKVAAGLHSGVPFEPIVLTPAEVRERQAKGDQFLAEVLEKGKVLYGKRGV